MFKKNEQQPRPVTKTEAANERLDETNTKLDAMLAELKRRLEERERQRQHQRSAGAR